jgi:HEAT repeat protein
MLSPLLLREGITRWFMNWGSQRLLLVTVALVASSLVSLAETPQHRAWEILETGTAEKSPAVRAMAVGSLGLVLHNSKAAAIAQKALEDEKPEVRAAGARALGEMRYAPSVPTLRKALADKDNSVVTAAAHSLVQLNDRGGYEFYYSLLTGERKKGQGLITRQMDVVRDPKKVAEFTLEEGIGFLPFGGYGLSAVKFIMSKEQEESSAKAVAARFLAADKDPQSGEALVQALSNKSWIVRQAALEAIAKRADPSLLEKTQEAMSDGKDNVRYTAAATVIRLTDARVTKEVRK